MKERGLGKSLEKNFSKLINNILPNSYWPSRSGHQNGYDAYARFKFDKMEYLWRFELKDLNAKPHKKNFNDIKEIEIKDFSDKIMQLMARESEASFPHVFCVVIPHKRIGNNNQLRVDLLSWNHFNKFPFEIVIWDFDLLFPALKNNHSQWVEAFYPNASKKFKDIQADSLNKKIIQSSRTGCLYNRSYIRTRKIKDSDRYAHALHIRITEDKTDSSDQNVTVEVNGSTQVVKFANFLELTVSKFPEPSSSIEKPVDKRRPLTKPPEGEAPVDDSRQAVTAIYNEQMHVRDIDLKKDRLANLFKDIRFSGKSLFDYIKELCVSGSEGNVSFIIDENVLLARVPFKELTSTHFDETSDITFAIEYTENE